jgi:hypothetical protein
LYDKYDRTNDRCARLFLLNSLSAPLKNKVQDKISESDGFPVVWIKFIKCVQSTSIERYEQIKTKIKACQPTQFSGQDLEKMSKDLRDASDTLLAAGQYDHNLTLTMLEAFLNAGGENNEDFRFPLRAVKQKLDQALLDIGYKDKEAATLHMTSMDLMPTDVCNLAEDLYQVRYEKGSWPPAKSVKDAKAPPSGYGANIGEVGDVGTPLTTAQVLMLIQQSQSSGGHGGRKGNCHNCGSSDHWLKDCPKPRNRNGNGGGGGRGNPGPSLKTTPPKPGEPQSKMINGKVMHWCAKCGVKGRWSTTHSTKEHTGGKPRDNAAANISESLLVDPSAWNVSMSDDFTSDMWNLFAPYLLCFGLGAYAALMFCGGPPIFDMVMQIIRWIVVWNWSLLAPTLWILSIVVTLFRQPLLDRHFPTPPPAAPPEPLTRRQRRAKAQQERRENRHGNQRRPGSIIDHGLHRNYPISLRGLGHYIRSKAPTAKERELQQQVDRLTRNVTSLRSKVRTLKNPNACRVTGREGEERELMNRNGYPVRNNRIRINHANNPQAYLRYDEHVVDHCRHRRPRGRKPSHQRYQPVPGSAFCDPGLGNNRFAEKQVNAVRKMQCHLSMAMANVSDIGVTLRMALQAPVKFRDSLPVGVAFNVIWDSGASISISNDKRDFVGEIKKPGLITQLKGIAKGLRIEGRGHVIWVMHDANGYLRKVKVPAFYVPKCRVKLLSTTSLLQEYEGETITVEAHQMTLSGVDGDPIRGAVTAQVNASNNLPTSIAYHFVDVPLGAQALTSVINEVSVSNLNLDEQQKELLRWHHRLGHIGFRKIQSLMRSGVLCDSEKQRRLHTACCKIVTPPLCAACQYGKQKRKPAPSKTATAVRDNVGNLKKDDLLPGQTISVDHFICSTKGRLLNSAGKTKASEMYDGGCIFADHGSGLVHVVFQTTIDTHETLKAKKKFETFCRDYGISPQQYQSDNGKPFTSQAFTEDLSTFQQIIKFAGVGAHHHNGVAERSIQSVMSIARTMMLHAAIHWPDTADPSLWPLAVQHAVYLVNHMPNLTTGLSPIDIFSRTRWEQRKFRDLHVWGCPVYVLNASMADGKKLPRWKPRSDRQMNMGLSPKHASTVPLYLDLETGYIKTAFHVVFDDWFATVGSDVSQLPEFQSDEWYKLFGESTYQYPLDEEDVAEIIRLDDSPTPQTLERRESVARAFDAARPPQPLPVAPLPEALSPMTPLTSDGRLLNETDKSPSTPLSSPRELLTPRERTPQRVTFEPRELLPALRAEDPIGGKKPLDQPAPPLPTHPPREKTPPIKPPILKKPPATNVQEPLRRSTRSSQASTPPEPLRRSTRNTKAPQRHGYDGNQSHGYCAVTNFDASTISFIPAAHVASNSDPDTLSYDEAMSDLDNKVEWQKSAVKEVLALVEKGTWDEVDISTAKSRILPGTWVFRKKRNGDGEIIKYKGRYCVRGDLQEGEFETYAPVVAWSTVRFFLVFAITFDWHTCSIDFSNAFVQSVLHDDVWIHLPRGFRSSRGPNTCLKLNKSLYGLAVAPLLWFKTISGALIDEGFTQSQNDKCFFYKKGFLIVLYVDDAGLAVKDPADIDTLLANLRAKGFEMTRESSFEEFLGIKFTKDDETGTITLTQKGLINKIIEATGMENCNPNWVPAAKEGLGMDPDGEPMDEEWNMKSIVGMLLYLSTNSRPDIAFAVSQVGRFTHNPKKSHAAAVKTIVRYLHRTRDKGTIINPTGELTLDCYVDADFAGLYMREPSDSPTSVKSRTGYVIMLGNVPLIWKSVLNSSISMCTQEAEYHALSLSMRALLPLRELIVEILDALDVPSEVHMSFRCRAFEDNNGALLLATNQRITNRTKYYCVKWHWFWSHVNDASKKISIVKIDTLQQRGDYLTKGLTRENFERIRKLVQGW